MKLIVAAVLLCSVCLTGFSQDFVITNSGDSLPGKIKFLSYDLVDRVQISDAKQKTNLTARQVREIHFDNDVYKPLQIENAIRFLRVEKSGYLSLMMIRDGIQVTSGGRYLVKSGGTATEVPNLTFKKVMIEFLSDAPKLQEKLRNGTYSKRDLEKIVDEYNAFIGGIAQRSQETAVLKQKVVEKAMPMVDLRTTVQALDAFDSKKDALDLIDDIILKVRANQNIPNYLIEGLQKYLAGIEPVKEKLDAAIQSVKP